MNSYFILRPGRAALAALIVLLPMVASATPSVDAWGPPLVSAAPPVGASKFVAVAPTRLADTRPGSSDFGGYTQLTADTIRVDITHRSGVPSDATAVVLNVTIAGASAAGYVTVYPGGSALPKTSNVYADAVGRTIANLVHAKIGDNGAVDILRSSTMDLVIDLVAVYVPVSGATSDGRLVTLANGAQRVFDTRGSGVPVGVGQTVSVDVAPAGIPSTASAVVVNVAAVNANAGFWTAFPDGDDLPRTGSLNLDSAGQTRAAQAIVNLHGGTVFNVFSQTGGHLVVDVVGYFTGTDALASQDGLFIAAPTPQRQLDTRSLLALPAWSGSTFEFGVGAGGLTVAAAVINITATLPWSRGYLTAYPAGVGLPNSANLSISAVPQTISNHAIVRVSTRGVALYTYGGAHLITDVTGWYLGTPTSPTQPPPTNPSYTRNTAVSVSIPKLRIDIGIQASVSDSYRQLDAIANKGLAAAFHDIDTVASPGNLMLFAHRTIRSAPFRHLNSLVIGDTFSVLGSDGHRYNYIVVSVRVTRPDYASIESLADPYGPITAQLVACSRLNGRPTSLSYRIVVTGRLESVT